MSKIINYVKTRPDAVTPTRAHPTDSGWDLTLVGIKKRFNILSDLDGSLDYLNSFEVIMYDTGLQLQPPPGYHTEIIPRSSISKTGYILANSIGLIDEWYRGNLYVAVIKLHPDIPDFPLPCCKFQFILRKREDAELVEVKFLDDTARGDGGFGSTDCINTGIVHSDSTISSGFDLKSYICDGELPGC